MTERLVSDDRAAREREVGRRVLDLLDLARRGAFDAGKCPVVVLADRGVIDRMQVVTCELGDADPFFVLFEDLGRG